MSSPNPTHIPISFFGAEYSQSASINYANPNNNKL